MLDIAGSARVSTAASELAARCGDALPYEVQVVASEDARIRVTSALPGRGAMRAAADDKLWDWLRTRAAAAARRVASRRSVRARFYCPPLVCRNPARVDALRRKV